MVRLGWFGGYNGPEGITATGQRSIMGNRDIASVRGKSYLEIPSAVVKRDGPFDEFKQDLAFVSVELDDGRIFEHLLILYPNYIIAMRGQTVLPFDPSRITRAFQTKEDCKLRSSSNWTFWPHAWSKE